MKAIVHLGMPKTGSTAIQSWLLANQTALAKRDIAYDHGNMPGDPPRRRQGVQICQQSAVGKLITNTALRAIHGVFKLEDQRKFGEQFATFFDERVASFSQSTWLMSSETELPRSLLHRIGAHVKRSLQTRTSQC